MAFLPILLFTIMDQLLRSKRCIASKSKAECEVRNSEGYFSSMGDKNGKTGSQ